MIDLPGLTATQKKKGYGDVVFAAMVLTIVGLLIVPLPTFVLDVLLTANISIAVVMLLTAIYIAHPLKLSTFPSILLVATLFRLALNVSSTRLILADADAGQVIDAFGDFVVQGNYVVGAVVFLILTVIQFLVIAKGSERVAEVAARFTLDAMPGKQMSIDADLRAGAFGLDEARSRRAALQKESQFFGAMDGAMKFVKGDAIAGIIITVVNVVGGLIIGIAQKGMSAGDATSVYTLLTVGDGLVSQIPALLISVSAGLIVTRVGATDDSADLGSEIFEQLGGTPRVFFIACAMLILLGIIPGLPLIPFSILGFAALGIGVLLTRRQEQARSAALEAVEVAPAPKKGEDPLVPVVTPVLLEVGPALSAAVRSGGGEDVLRDEIAGARRAFFQRLGVRLPQVRIRFGATEIGDNDARIKVFEVTDSSFVVDPDRSLVLASMDAVNAAGIDAFPTFHPFTGAPSADIAAADNARAVAAGLAVASTSRRLMLHVAGAARRHAGSFVGLAEVQVGLNQLEGSHGALIEAVTPRPVSLARLTGVLKRLVEEGVPIRDFRAILEALAERADEDTDLVDLAEIARVGLRRSIVEPWSRDGVVHAWLVSASIEATVRESIRRDRDRTSLALPPQLTTEIIDAFRPAFGKGRRAALVVCSQDVRRFLRQLLLLEFPAANVLGMDELHGVAQVQSLGTINVGRTG